MKHFVLTFLILSGVSLATRGATGGSWQHLLDRADSLVTAGHTDAALAAIDKARSLAMSQYEKSDSTVEIGFTKDGVTKSHYFRSYDDVDSLFSKILTLNERIYGPDHIEVANTLDYLVSLNVRLGRSSEAVTLLSRIIKIRETALGPEHKSVATALSNLGNSYQNLGMYAEAESTLARALVIKEKAYGPDHLSVAQSLNILGWVCYNEGKYERAESLYTRAIGIREKELGPDHVDVAASLNNLAILYDDQGRYDEAEPLYERGLEIREKTMGPDHPDVATSLSDLATLNLRRGNFSVALAMHERALAIRLKAFGREHPHVAISMNNMANVLVQMGRDTEAEPLYRDALAILEPFVGPEHPFMAQIHNNLGIIYFKFARYDDAEREWRAALAINRKALGEDHVNVASNLNNLGILYQTQLRYAEAETTYTQALGIYEKSVGPDHPETGTVLHNLANTYVYQDKYQEAESAYRRAESIYRAVYGSDHPMVAQEVYGRAIVCIHEDRFDEAGPMLEQVLETRRAFLGSDHPLVAETLDAMCRYYRKRDQAERSFQCAAEAARIRIDNFQKNGVVLSEVDALTYSQFMRVSLGECLTSFFALDEKERKRSTAQVVNMILAAKGRISDGIFERRRAIVTEADPATLALADSLRLVQYRFSELVLEGPDEDMEGHRREVDSLGTAAEAIETELTKHSEQYRRFRETREVSYDRIASLLPEHSVLVEYLEYKHLALKPDAWITCMAAVVIENGKDPVVLDLGEASPFNFAVDQYRNHFLEITRAGVLPTKRTAKSYRPIGKRLAGIAWEPLDRYVNGKDLVIIAPDGALNLVSFAGLPDGDGYLIERHAIHYLSSARDAVRYTDDIRSGTGLFALGDPDFDATPEARRAYLTAPPDTTSTDTGATAVAMRGVDDALRGVVLTPLPGTRAEVELVVQRWKEVMGEPVTEWLGAGASEELLRAALPGRRVAHLATHGFSFDTRYQPEPSGRPLGSGASVAVDNPLLRSGLYLAGANLHGTASGSAAIENGVLTAYEVSALELDGTDLVVLSACETGLGRVEAGEGVYGLRRAFQMAGARTVISSLWRVDDEDTADLLGRLYESGTLSVPETMRRIQLEKIRNLRAGDATDHPFHWAGFVAVGDWGWRYW